jgi:hypothetical protein
VFHQEERTKATQPNTDQETLAATEDQSSLITMNNYFGIGIDADVCLAFGNKVFIKYHNS